MINTWWCQWKGGSAKWTKSGSPLLFAGVTLRSVTDAVVLGPRTLPVSTYTFTFSLDEKNGIMEETFTDSATVVVNN